MRPIRFAALAVSILSAAVSCTLLGSGDVVQCDGDFDCPTVRPSCVANLCTALATMDAAAEAPPRQYCDTTESCPQGAGQFVCVDHGCVRATTPDCPLILPANSTYREEPVIVIGAYLSSPTDSPAKSVLQFALDEVNSGLHPPHIAAVLCEKREPLTENSARSAVAHLGELGVSLAVGEFDVAEIIATAAAADTHRMAIWSTLGNHPTVHPSGSTFQTDAFLVDELEKLEDTLQSAVDRALERADEVNGGRIATPKVVVAGSPKIADINPLLTFLRTRLTVRAGASISFFPVESSLEPTPNVDNAAQIRDIVASAPHVVVGVGGNEIVKQLVRGVELAAGATTPVYVVTTRAKYNLNDILGLITTTKRPNFRSRLIGVDFSGAREKHSTFMDSAKALTGNQLVGSYDYFYDAMYAVAYASVIAARSRDGGAGPLTSEELLSALLRLGADDPAADLIGVGQAEMLKGVDRINVGKPVRFDGVTGLWTFDVVGHTRRMGTSIFCFEPKKKDSAGEPSELDYYLDLDSAFDGGCATPQ